LVSSVSSVRGTVRVIGSPYSMVAQSAGHVVQHLFLLLGVILLFVFALVFSFIVLALLLVRGSVSESRSERVRSLVKVELQMLQHGGWNGTRTGAGGDVLCDSDSIQHMCETPIRHSQCSVCVCVYVYV